MNELWRPKTNYKQLDSRWKSIADILPYVRLYDTLTQEQLRELLRDARRLHWEVLDLHRCGLYRLPDELGDLPDLRILDIGNGYWRDSDIYRDAKKNSFAWMPDSIGNLANLQRLYVNRTQITTLPDSIGSLANLQWLNVSETQLIALPDSIGDLANLKLLDVGRTQLTALPDSIGNPANLKWLYAYNTQITALPDSIGNLKSLKSLHLQYCRINAIPYSLVQLGLPFRIDDPIADNCINLYEVTLGEGDISLFGRPREVIEEYYRNSVREAASECKVIFLGDGQTGKSSLIERMVNDTFEEGVLPTNGVKMTRWTAWPGKGKAPLTLPDGTPLVLRLLDFGGQEIMHAMHRCFLTAHTVYVIVCESRDDTDIDRAARRWMETVRSFAPDCPVILALNKSDLNNQVTVNETALKDSNPSFQCSIRTSAKKNKDPGVQQLIDRIFEAVPGCIRRLTGNKGFLALKQDLEAMEKDYIKPEQFREKCDRYKITENLRTGLLDWFRDLGVAYPYAVTFREVYVLNPAWLTNGIYRLILRTQPTGFLKHSDIRVTLGKRYENDVDPDKTYTPQEMDFILHVMRQFEISLCVTPNAPDCVEMIPMKLEKNTPGQVESMKRAAVLHLRWQAAYLPNTLVHRLMIRRYEDLDTDCVWRTGGRFLSIDRGCELLAEMTGDRALDIYASGKYDVRSYMNGFRELILRILGELNITAKEYIFCRMGREEGKISYRTVLTLYRLGEEKMYVEDLDTFVSPKDILRENYLNMGAEMETRDFFISYNNRHDEENAQWIADTLRAEGYTVHFQKYDCKPGSSFPQWMDDAIHHSRGFLAVWSDSYKHSQYCQSELNAAFVKNRKFSGYLLLLARVEDVPVSDLFQPFVRVDLLSDKTTNCDRLLDAAEQIRSNPTPV